MHIGALELDTAPAVIHDWVQNSDPEPMQRDIDIERFKQGLDVCRDGQNLASTNKLHPHFCLSVEDCRLAWHEGVANMGDAVSHAAIQ
jgi:pterin-4a-carbinolamine dehydratase